MFTHAVQDGVRLVLAEPRHAEAVAELIASNFDRLAEFEPWGDAPPATDVMRARIQERGEAFAQGRGLRAYIQTDGRFIGSCGLRIDVRSRSAEVGFFLDRAYEGKGLASACVRVMVRLAFVEYDMQRVTLKTHAGNDRSRRLAERLGFHYEGTARQAIRFSGDRYEDEANYALVVDDWRTSDLDVT
jgi:ribosomal-protein-serine acetyltransferase